MGWSGMPFFIMKIYPITYRRARNRIRSGDVLLYRAGRKLTSRAIASAGSSPYSHAAMAVRSHRVLLCVEMLTLHGGRAVTLSSQVEDGPGQWDVYRPRGKYVTHRAAAEILRQTGTPYGWLNLGRMALRRFWPWARMLTDDELNDSPPFCSQAVSRACRAGGIDPRPNAADCATEPGHLADKGFANYQFTLFGTDEQIATFQELEEAEDGSMVKISPAAAAGLSC